jgi:hypothetical protein
LGLYSGITDFEGRKTGLFKPVWLAGSFSGLAGGAGGGGMGETEKSKKQLGIFNTRQQYQKYTII